LLTRGTVNGDERGSRVCVDIVPQGIVLRTASGLGDDQNE
jgi:hypothetical protein